MYLDVTLETLLADAISPRSESTMFEDVFNAFSNLLSQNTFTTIVQES
jgi:hypothetical protein